MEIEKSAENKTIVNNLNKSQGLSAFWQSRIAATTSALPKPLLPKEHGQLKRLKESLGMEKATQLIAYALNHWQEFGFRAKEGYPGAPVPERPQIGFLLKYHATALVMLSEMQSAAKQEAEDVKTKNVAQAKVKNEAAVSNSHPPVKVITCTPEQIAAYLNPDDETNSAFLDAMTEKYGEWRPAKWGEKGIPCDVDLKLAA